MENIIGSIIDGKSSDRLSDDFYYMANRPGNLYGDIIYCTNPNTLKHTAVFTDRLTVVDELGKSTLKRYIKYLILYWLKKNVLTEDDRQFNGIELIKFVRVMVNKPDMYSSTITKYMNELNNDQLSIGYHSVSRQKSIYCLDWFSLVAFDNYYE